MGPPHTLPGAGLATDRGVQSSLWGTLVRSVCPDLGESDRDMGSTDPLHWLTSFLGSHHASGQEHDSFPPESVNGRPVLVDHLDLCYKPA